MNWLNILMGRPPAKPSSTATLRREPGGIFALRLGGVLNKATLDNIQAVARRDIEAGSNALKVLLILNDFRGWKSGDNWGDLDFFERYEACIAKIAVVGDIRWKPETLLFLGAGQRRGSVSFFLPLNEREARAWLAE